MAESEAINDTLGSRTDSGPLKPLQSGQLANAALVNIINPATLASKQILNALTSTAILDSPLTRGHAHASQPEPNHSSDGRKNSPATDSTSTGLEAPDLRPQSNALPPPAASHTTHQPPKPHSLPPLSLTSEPVSSSDTSGAFSVSGSAPSYPTSNTGRGAHTPRPLVQSHEHEKARDFERERHRLQIHLQLLHPLQKSLYLPMSTSTSYTAPNTSRAPPSQLLQGQPEDTTRLLRDASNNANARERVRAAVGPSRNFARCSLNDT